MELFLFKAGIVGLVEEFGGRVYGLGVRISFYVVRNLEIFYGGVKFLVGNVSLVMEVRFWEV